MSGDELSLVVRYQLERAKQGQVLRLVFVRDHGTAQSVTCCDGGTCWTGEDVERWLDQLELEPRPFPSAEAVLRKLAQFPTVTMGAVRLEWAGGWEGARCDLMPWLREWLPAGHRPPAVKLTRGGKPR